ncbi:MAG: hypothetical protein ACI8XO_001739 [Verrucomicrobiales bacterium]|jgi:uncharacterized protein YuzE
MKSKITLRVPASPSIEIDSEAGSVYVRFSNKSVERTEPVKTDGCFVAIDYDKAGDVVGVELLNIREFTFSSLRDQLPVKVSKDLMDKARLVTA